MKKSEAGRRLRHTQGTASVEIVVMLPVFLLLFSAAFYVYGRASARQQALSSARGCAFQYAMHGCETVKDAVDLCSEAEPEKLADLEGDDFTGVFSMIEDVPLVGQAVETLFGEGAGAHAKRATRGFMGAENPSFDERVYLVCNTKSRTITGHIIDSFCGFGRSVLKKDIPGC